MWAGITQNRWSGSTQLSRSACSFHSPLCCSLYLCIAQAGSLSSLGRNQDLWPVAGGQVASPGSQQQKVPCIWDMLFCFVFSLLTLFWNKWYFLFGIIYFRKQCPHRKLFQLVIAIFLHGDKNMTRTTFKHRYRLVLHLTFHLWSDNTQLATNIFKERLHS